MPRINFRHHDFDRRERRDFHNFRRPEFQRREIFNEYHSHHHNNYCPGPEQEPEQESSGPKTVMGKLIKNLGKADTIGFGLGSFALYEARKQGNIFNETTVGADGKIKEGSSTGNVVGGTAQGILTGASMGSLTGLGTGWGALAGGSIGLIGKLFGGNKTAGTQEQPKNNTAKDITNEVITGAKANPQDTQKPNVLAGIGKVLGGMFGLS